MKIRKTVLRKQAMNVYRTCGRRGRLNRSYIIPSRCCSAFFAVACLPFHFYSVPRPFMTNRVHRGEERSRAVSRPAELEEKQKTICCSFILQRRVKKSLANSSQTRGGECTSSADRACDLKCVYHMDIGIEECRY